MEDGVRRLIIRPGAIGDFIVSLPAMEWLRCEYLEVWAGAPNVPLARFADGARPIGSTGLDLLGISEPPPALIEGLRSFDSIISWYGANRPDFRELVASLGLPFQFFPALPGEGAGVHAADFYLQQVWLRQRRYSADRVHRGARRLRRNPAIRRQPEKALADGAVPGTGAQARGAHARRLVRRTRGRLAGRHTLRRSV
jgi:hypothetical protein